eukprot:TRINITY_DN2925_c0_g1_i2.p1 TRINITY_DN2925_c0_g1~~TRINITY_DN2925_c0_g1_i2.p1  ORF type:complete len:1344 (+),score=317.02 TRINITY_DN2925_c0_g1_i2:207-4238(+)
MNRRRRRPRWRTRSKPLAHPQHAPLPSSTSRAWRSPRLPKSLEGAVVLYRLRVRAPAALAVALGAPGGVAVADAEPHFIVAHKGAVVVVNAAQPFRSKLSQSVKVAVAALVVREALKPAHVAVRAGLWDCTPTSGSLHEYEEVDLPLLEGLLRRFFRVQLPAALAESALPPATGLPTRRNSESPLPMPRTEHYALYLAVAAGAEPYAFRCECREGESILFKYGACKRADERAGAFAARMCIDLAAAARRLVLLSDPSVQCYAADCADATAAVLVASSVADQSLLDDAERCLRAFADGADELLPSASDDEDCSTNKSRKRPASNKRQEETMTLPRIADVASILRSLYDFGCKATFDECISRLGLGSIPSTDAAEVKLLLKQRITSCAAAVAHVRGLADARFAADAPHFHCGLSAPFHDAAQRQYRLAAAASATRGRTLLLRLRKAASTGLYDVTEGLDHVETGATRYVPRARIVALYAAGERPQVQLRSKSTADEMVLRRCEKAAPGLRRLLRSERGLSSAVRSLLVATPATQLTPCVSELEVASIQVPFGETQRAAFARAALARVALICGPSGTGKSMWCALAVCQMLLFANLRSCIRFSVLVTGETDRAVLSTLDKIRSLLSENRIQGVTCHQLLSGSERVDAVRRMHDDPFCITGATASQLLLLPRTRRPQVDLVVLDDAHQLRAAHAALICDILKPSGRLVVVGDPSKLLCEPSEYPDCSLLQALLRDEDGGAVRTLHGRGAAGLPGAIYLREDFRHAPGLAETLSRAHGLPCAAQNATRCRSFVGSDAPRSAAFRELKERAKSAKVPAAVFVELSGAVAESLEEVLRAEAALSAELLCDIVAGTAPDMPARLRGPHVAYCAFSEVQRAFFLARAPQQGIAAGDDVVVSRADMLQGTEFDVVLSSLAGLTCTAADGNAAAECVSLHRVSTAVASAKMIAVVIAHRSLLEEPTAEMLSDERALAGLRYLRAFRDAATELGGLVRVSGDVLSHVPAAPERPLRTLSPLPPPALLQEQEQTREEEEEQYEEQDEEEEEETLRKAEEEARKARKTAAGQWAPPAQVSAAATSSAVSQAAAATAAVAAQAAAAAAMAATPMDAITEGPVPTASHYNWEEILSVITEMRQNPNIRFDSKHEADIRYEWERNTVTCWRIIQTLRSELSQTNWNTIRDPAGYLQSRITHRRAAFGSPGVDTGSAGASPAVATSSFAAAAQAAQGAMLSPAAAAYAAMGTQLEPWQQVILGMNWETTWLVASQVPMGLGVQLDTGHKTQLHKYFERDPLLFWQLIEHLRDRTATAVNLNNPRGFVTSLINKFTPAMSYMPSADMMALFLSGVMQAGHPM